MEPQLERSGTNTNYTDHESPFFGTRRRCKDLLSSGLYRRRRLCWCINKNAPTHRLLPR